MSPSRGTAIAIALAIVYAPAIISLMLADPLRGWLQRLSPMMAGLAVQRTVLRADSVPIGNSAGLVVAAAWSAVALVTAIHLVRHRGRLGRSRGRSTHAGMTARSGRLTWPS